MALSGEEITEIAESVASRVIARSGLVCSCSDIEPLFLQGIEDIINRATSPGEFGARSELRAKLNRIANQCGYEKDEGGAWVEFPKQEKALQSLGASYEIVTVHDDGDLTIKIPEHNSMAVVTTEGEIFTKPGIHHQQKSTSSQAMPYLISRCPLFPRKGYRVDIPNWGISRDATAGDIVRFEQKELGNDLGVSEDLLRELDNYSYTNVIWVTKEREDAAYYLSEGMTEADISEIDLGEGARIVAENGQGGFLVLRGSAKPQKI
jgi:hypothetical protein